MDGEMVGGILISGWSGKPSLKRWYFSLDLNKVRDWAIETSRGREFQEERKATSIRDTF